MLSIQDFLDKYYRREYHKYGSPESQIHSESKENFEAIGVEEEKEIKLHVAGAEFPRRTCVMDTALYSTNMIKSVIIESIKIATMPQNVTGTLITILLPKYRQSTIYAFNKLGKRIISHEILKDIHRTSFGRELQFFIFNFMRHLTNEQDAEDFSEIVSVAIENDDAYRYRIMDILSETKKHKLKNVREIKRLLHLFHERNYNNVWGSKVNAIATLLFLALKIPSIKRAYINAVEHMILDNMQLQEEDIYWALYKSDYKVLGMNTEEKKEFINKKGWKMLRDVV
jgi:hypothetical protein